MDSYREFEPHVALLDLGMPEVDGFEICRRIRQLPDSADVLIVIVSGYVLDEIRVKAIEAGANFYMTKPADPARLLALIEQCGGE